MAILKLAKLGSKSSIFCLKIVLRWGQLLLTLGMKISKSDFKVGLAFSGGGFRAASFSLGVLSYLNIIEYSDRKLLDNVVALSTVSGGSITGTQYAIGIKRGKSFESVYKTVYDFMVTSDLVDLSLDQLASKKVDSLIKAFANIYDNLLFDSAEFGELFEEKPTIHLKHISFNATEFANGLQFRFQKSEDKASKKNSTGIIGNHYYRISEEVAKKVRMGDILAASSCFPGGFEPINFPTDFGLSNNDVICKDNQGLPVGLMDGGIVDNQGIEPLLLVDRRMQSEKESNSEGNSNFGGLDLLLLVDVASPYMDDYKATQSVKRGFWRNLTLKSVFFTNFLVLLGSISGLVWGILSNRLLLSICFSVLTTVSLFAFILARFVKALPAKFKVPGIFMKPLRKLLKIQLGVYESMTVNRINSLMKMTNDVFLKHIRRLNYRQVYNDDSWKNRRIMSAIYELADREKLARKVKKNTMKEELLPSEAIEKVANRAKSMGTTLWFTKEELRKGEDNRNMAEAIIACGQFTLCWNLLLYIEKLKVDSENTNTAHEALMICEPDLMKHWKKFQENPYWLIKEFD